MKLILSALLASAALVAASPLQEISISIDVNEGHPSLQNYNEVCLMACFSEKPECRSPSYPKEFGECWTCCTKLGEDLLPSAHVIGESPLSSIHVLEERTHSLARTTSYDDDICLMVCWPESPKCNPPSFAKQFGECWTCCMKRPTIPLLAIDVTEEKARSMDRITDSVTGEICLLICFPEKSMCPSEWNPKNMGSKDEPCWTCCRTPPELKSLPSVRVTEEKAQSMARTTDPVTMEVCLKVCWPSVPSCPVGWYSNNFGNVEQPCWTCCKAPELNSLPAAKAPQQTIQSKDIQTFEICLKACWPIIPTCPDGWYSNNTGTEGSPCWTCCKAPSVLLDYPTSRRIPSKEGL